MATFAHFIIATITAARASKTHYQPSRQISGYWSTQNAGRARRSVVLRHYRAARPICKHGHASNQWLAIFIAGGDIKLDIEIIE
jgi:hypothetical protein